MQSATLSGDRRKSVVAQAVAAIAKNIRTQLPGAGMDEDDPSKGPPLQRQHIMKQWQFREMIDDAEDSLFDDFESEQNASIEEEDEENQDTRAKEKESKGSLSRAEESERSYRFRSPEAALLRA